MKKKQRERLCSCQKTDLLKTGDFCWWYLSNGRKWTGTKEPLDECERESEKTDLKLNIQKTKIMASNPITSWQIDGEQVETVADFIFLGSKITVDSDGRHKIKRHLLLGRSYEPWKWKLLSCVRLLVTPWTVVHRILQARILEWVAFPFSRGSSQPRDWTQVSHMQVDSLPAEPKLWQT